LDRIKRFLFPLAILFLIVIVLVYRLSSCSLNNDKKGIASPGASSAIASVGASASSSDSPSAASPSVKASVSPEVNYSNDDILKLFKKEGFEVGEIRDSGSATVVEFIYPGATGDIPSSFAWFDRTTGAREVVGGGLAVDKFEITPQKSLTVLTTGKYYVNGSQWFPELFRSDFNDGTGAVRYSNEMYPYFMPIDKSFTVSRDRPESLKSVTLDYDAVSVGFAPQPGHEQEFEIAYRFIPKTSVVTSGGVCYITFFNTTLAPGFRTPKTGDGDSLRSFMDLKYDGANSLLTLKLGDKADRYNVSMDYSPDDGMPYAVIRFRSDDAIYPPYPKGW
jgi:hypothetical protein